MTAGASGYRTAYRLPNGRVVMFKQIRPVRLPTTCAGCRFNNATDCQEGYYGVRLYRDRLGGYLVGVCIQRMDLCMPVEEFVQSDLCAEVLRLRDEEYRRLGRITTLQTNHDRESPAVPTEYEAKVLDIDPAAIAERILKPGAAASATLDAPLRLRHRARRHDQVDPAPRHGTGTESTLTVKEIAHDGIDGTHEVEVAVSDFDATNELLGRSGSRRSRTRRTGAPASNSTAPSWRSTSGR